MQRHIRGVNPGDWLVCANSQVDGGTILASRTVLAINANNEFHPGHPGTEALRNDFSFFAAFGQVSAVERPDDLDLRLFVAPMTGRTQP